MHTAITRETLEQLWNHTGNPCISLYMPTHEAGPEVQADPIRLKNLLVRAGESLQALGHRAPEAQALLAPAAGLAEQGSFWREGSAGLAVFVAPGLFETARLHEAPAELAVVGGHFHTKPLVAEWLNDMPFYLLAATLKEVRLYRGDRLGLQPVDLGDAPASLEAFLAYDEVGRSSHAWRQSGSAVGAGEAALRGTQDTDQKMRDDVRRFFQAVDKGVQAAARERELPLLWAGVEEWLGMYREVSAWPQPVQSIQAGSPEHMSAKTLHERAWAVVAPLLEKRHEAARARLHDALGTGRAAGELEAVLGAAREGRVATLFCAADAHRWGMRNEEGGSAELHDEQDPGDEDLLDAALRETLRHGGEAHVVASDALPAAPGAAETGLAALYRY